MSPTISAKQRNLVYDEVLVSLSGIDDVWRAVAAGDYDLAGRLGQEQSDNLLLLSDLGWGSTASKPVELTTDRAVLQRIFRRIRNAVVERQAVGGLTAEEERHNHRLFETCAGVLDELGTLSPNSLQADI